MHKFDFELPKKTLRIHILQMTIYCWKKKQEWIFKLVTKINFFFLSNTWNSFQETK